METIIPALNNLRKVAAGIICIVVNEKQFMMVAADMIFSPWLATAF